MIAAVMPTYARYDVALERGEGVYAFGTDGRRYLDFGAGIAVASLGHCHPHLVEALKTQAETLWHVSNLYNIPGQERLAERLVTNTFADAVFFNNSGNEAVELGFKMMRKFQSENGHPERYRIISVEGAFHGRSLAGLSAGKQEKQTAGFGPLTDGFDQVAFGNLGEMKSAVTAKTAGIVIEPIQGEGGIRPMDDDYLRGVRAICDDFNLLLQFDEVQTGIGRTGKLFAYQWPDVKPDILSSAKGLGGGFPVGATIATEKVAATMGAGSHGSTFGGNPLAMACANAVLDVVLSDGFLENVNSMSERLREGLNDLVTKYPHHLTGVRGKGLLLGLRFRGDGSEAGAMVAKANALGLLSVPAGDNIMRLIPPLIIADAHVDEALGILNKALAETAGRAD